MCEYVAILAVNVFSCNLRYKQQQFIKDIFLADYIVCASLFISLSDTLRLFSRDATKEKINENVFIHYRKERKNTRMLIYLFIYLLCCR